MRAVEYDPKKLSLPPDWAERAEALKKRLLKENDPLKRSEIIRKNEIWSEIKFELRKVFSEKCWYTESPQRGTDTDVDHFRPKRRVFERSTKGDEHPGYWWLAYDLDNYRYSCIYANRLRRDIETDLVGGKADRFPVVEATRAMGPDANWKSEKTYLIDPCNPDEVAMITFKEDGEAMARFPASEQYKHDMAMLSIECYNINHSDFVKARMDVKASIEELRVEAKRLFARLEDGDADHKQSYRQAISTLRKMREKTAPYSAFCIAITDSFRGDESLAGIFL
ncbi:MULTISPECIES: hypothetical protein [Rhizobium]|uniref:hypothetical protein n=1 Tax=Rhizobium TaxID=379 RepID=UPI000BEA2CFB|nr:MULTISPECIES: hypothetical protein [Rhizobium]MBY4592316.1 hypothetical protein [Rhizobium redzepovicii]MBY4613186.1 hypothetical protein [Rhizobium redzepovicii]MDF0657996.1 hypothetical protein [Rhizobium sp. BC49]PDS88158.1 hypothetical protein CO654_02095 [Rhizobium sp. L18]TBY44915.1 hypothetical protein E0H54_24015 [Rhizobium leguminosarum bv. viciae]